MIVGMTHRGQVLLRISWRIERIRVTVVIFVVVY